MPIAKYVLTICVFILQTQVPALDAQKARATRLHDGNPQLSGMILSSSAFDNLIEVGYTSGIPLGIVVEGDALCTSRFDLRQSRITVSQLIARIKSDVPGYTAEITDETLYVHPLQVDTLTSQVLDLITRDFGNVDGNYEQVSVSLWMFMRATLAPNEGTAVNWSSLPLEVKAPSFHFERASVREILNRIVSGGAGGVWIMRPASVKWERSPTTPPYELHGYAEENVPSIGLSCQKLKEPLP